MEIHLVAILSIKSFEGTDEIIKYVFSKNVFEFPIFETTYPAMIIDNKFIENLGDKEQKYFEKIYKYEDQEPIIIMSSFNIPPPNEEIKSSVGDGPINVNSKEYQNINEFIAEDTFRKRILDLIISFNLSFCGGINIVEGRLFRNGKLVNNYNVIYNDLEFGKQLSIKVGWPTLTNLPLNQTFNWLMNFKNDMDNISNSRIGRAVNAFTYLFHDSFLYEDDLSDLLWSLVGLESIYTDGNTDLQNQLDYKSQLLLGERKEFKKVVKNMYEYRSKYVHGKLNFASRFSGKDTTDFIEKFSPELSEASNTAISTFTATLQHFVKNNITDINFLRTYNYEITTSKIKNE